ncbi:hypothetical protein RvY_04574 [Ramazzottius varieornatus]|uniref:Uncharacterized protein n=1 Tax=Ramazzottius varieornatus TaxID=947166 RepID=A0A1D1V215_RAMVA|nr:hypothetical protein RvY_04574 [Ramazzottius varieornatus]
MKNDRLLLGCSRQKAYRSYYARCIVWTRPAASTSFLELGSLLQEGVGIVRPEYSLLTYILPATCNFKYLNVVRITSLLLPIRIKDCGYAPTQNGKAVFAKEDIEFTAKEMHSEEFATRGIKLEWFSGK